MSYYSRQYMTLLGKITAVIMALQLIYIFGVYPIFDAIVVYISSTAAWIPLLFRKHEDELAEYGESDAWAEYGMKIILPSFLLTLVFSWIGMRYISVPASIASFVKPDLFSFVFFAMLLGNLWFLCVYFLNTYLRYRGVDSLFVRIFACTLVAIVLGIAVCFLVWMKLMVIIPLTDFQQFNPNSINIPKT